MDKFGLRNFDGLKGEKKPNEEQPQILSLMSCNVQFISKFN